jgi:hypothetical protein
MSGEFNGYSETYAVGYAMKIWGGGFMKGIGEALMNADDNNRQKILDTWPEDYALYRNLAKRLPKFGGEEEEE